MFPRVKFNRISTTNFHQKSGSNNTTQSDLMLKRIKSHSRNNKQNRVNNLQNPNQFGNDLSTSFVPQSWWLQGMMMGFISGLLANEWYKNYLENKNDKQTKAISSTAYSLSNLLYAENQIPKVEYKARIANGSLELLGGNEEIIDKVADIVRYLDNPEKYTQLGASAPKGVILSGPPGVGKTFMAEAIAGHAGVPIIMVSASELLGMYIGQTEKNMQALFAAATKASPCILCIDEIDSIGQKRFQSPQHGSEHWANTMVNQMLALLSQDRPGVVVVVTTNNYESLDTAFVREGRFDRHIRVPMPNVSDREAILAIHTKGKNLSSKISLKELAALTTGFSGAKIAAWVTEAARCAGRRNSKTIDLKDFDEARIMLNIGIARKSITTPEHKMSVAVHESGHAVVGHLLNQKLYQVTTLQHGQAYGFTEWLPKEGENYSEQELLDIICTALAGRAAEKLSGKIMVGASTDIEKAKQVATKMVTEEGMGKTISGLNVYFDVEEILSQQLERACNLLKDNQKKWDQVKNALLKHDVLHREDFLRVLEGKTISSRAHAESTAKTTLALPPKKASRVLNPSSLFNESTSVPMPADLPFTLAELAKALNVDANKIREIKRNIHFGGSYMITFKPSYRDFLHLESLSSTLKQHDVENHASTMEYSNYSLEIYDAGWNDFVEYIKKKNSLKQSITENIVDTISENLSDVKSWWKK